MPVLQEALFNDSKCGTSSSDGLESLRESERLIAYTDAVVAIAQTLLILPLMDAAREADDVREWYNRNHNLVLTFFLSFYVLTLFWLGHDRLFSRVRRLTQVLVLLDFARLRAEITTAFSGASARVEEVSVASRLTWTRRELLLDARRGSVDQAWLLTVVVLPIATILTKDSDNKSVVFYLSVMLANRIIALLMVLEVRREPRTWAGARGPSLLSVIAHGILLALFGLCLILALTTQLHFAVLGLTAMWGPIMGVIKRAWPELDDASAARAEKSERSASFTEG